MNDGEANNDDQGPRLEGRIGNVVQGIAIIAIVGLAVDAVNVRISIAVSQEQIRNLAESERQRSRRIDDNARRLQAHRREPDHPGAKARLSALEARIDYLIRQVDGDHRHLKNGKKGTSQ